jgi:oligoribonuclease
MSYDKILWIDLETTGLDAREEVPLELGLAISDLDGNILTSESWLIHDDTAHYKERIARAKEHEIVGPMHEASGLWADLDNRDKLEYFSCMEADKWAASWVKANDATGLPLAGSSIGSLDRPFVLEHFPDLNVTAHYRNIDVSTVKELCRRYNAPLYEQLTAQYADQRKESHRVLDDIKDSIAELKGYVENFLFEADERF